MTIARLFFAGSVAVVTAIACGGGSGGSSSTSTSGNGFPFSGPSCPSGTQPSGMPASAACAQCIDSQCSEQCLVSDCSAYYDCACACAPNDAACAQGCAPQMTQACQTCLAGITGCFFGTCGSSCFGGLLDAGLGGLLDAGFGGHCSQLAPCCSSLATTAEQMACAQLVAGGNDAACQQGLAMYGDGGHCN